MKRLKIAILIDLLVAGGVQKAAIHEAHELIKMGYTVTLFVLVRLKYDYQYEDISQGLTIIHLSDFNPSFFRRALRLPFFSFLTHLHLLSPYFVSRYHILKDYDFIISHGTTTCITAAAISKKWKIPYLAFIWDPLVFVLEKVYGQHFIIRKCIPFIKPLVEKYEKDFLYTAALVVTSSRVHQQYIMNKYSNNPLVVHPGMSTFSKTPPKSGRFVLGYTRWQLAKNPYFFLQLAKKMPQLTFIIAGEWSNKDEEYIFQKEIMRLKLTKQVKLFPKVTAKDLPKLARMSFVWLHPHFEAFGMSGLEMAALGLPLIIPQGSGVTELFTHNKEGFFPATLDLQKISKYLSFLSARPTVAVQMGRAAAKRARVFTWKSHTLLLRDQITAYLSQTKIVTTINAFVSTFATGGGDRFFIELARRIPDSAHLTIVLPWIGLSHFQKASIDKPNIRYILLSPNPFDQREDIFSLFLAYLIRAWQTMFLLAQLPPFTTLHTTTDLIADTMPAYIYRSTHQKSIWIARFFHFYAPPWKRRGSFFRNTGSYLLQRFSLLLFTKADAVLVDNPLLKNDLEMKLSPHTKILISPGGVELEKIRTLRPKPAFKSTALFIGRLSAHKGVYDAIEAWRIAHTHFPKYKLTLLGYCPPNEMKQIQAKVSDLNLGNVITFVGFVHERKLVYEYLRSSKMLLFLDHEAGFGLVVAEAMAAGLPVIAYNLPIFGSVYTQGFVTAEVANTHQVADTIVKLLSHKNTYKQLSNEAKLQAKLFDWVNVSNQFYQIVTSYEKKQVNLS